jgi:hypothetical protein
MRARAVRSSNAMAPSSVGPRIGGAGSANGAGHAPCRAGASKGILTCGRAMGLRRRTCYAKIGSSTLYNEPKDDPTGENCPVPPGTRHPTTVHSGETLLPGVRQDPVHLQLQKSHIQKSERHWPPEIRRVIVTRVAGFRSLSVLHLAKRANCGDSGGTGHGAQRRRTADLKRNALLRSKGGAGCWNS